jgi:hypothetical protein
MAQREIDGEVCIPLKSFALAILVCTCLSAVVVRAQQRSDRNTTSKHAAANQMLADMAWMSGSWSGPGLGGQAEEHWTGIAGGSMIGTFRLVGSNDKLIFCELIMIEREGPRVVGRFRHFGPKHTPWEPLDAPLVLDLVRVTPTEAVFEAPAGASPKRLTYGKESGGKLSIRLQSERDGALHDTFLLTLARTELGK